MTDSAVDEATLAQLLTRELTLAEAGGATGSERPEPVDLRTIVGELIALKSEVRAETRSTRETRKSLDDALALLQGRIAEVDLERERTDVALREAREAGELSGVEALVDVADRLGAALATLAVPYPRRWWRRRPPPVVGAIRQGLGITLDRVTRSIEDLGGVRLHTVGDVFDPHKMRAVDTADDPCLDDGVVISEVLPGYTHRRRVLRSAHVVINRRSAP